jgi:hypothetical protein
MTGDEKADLNYGLVYVENEIDGTKTEQLKMLPVITAQYRDKKKDGTLKDKPTDHNMMASHCPFCGEKVGD